MTPVVLCACKFCHPDGPVDVNDPVESALACDRCKPNHVYTRTVKGPSFRREKFDITPPFPADATGTSEDDDDGETGG